MTPMSAIALQTPSLKPQTPDMLRTGTARCLQTHLPEHPLRAADGRIDGKKGRERTKAGRCISSAPAGSYWVQ